MKLIDLFALLVAGGIPIVTAVLMLFFQPESLLLRFKLISPKFRKRVVRQPEESSWCSVRALAWWRNILYLEVIEERFGPDRKKFLIALSADAPYAATLWENRRNEGLCLCFKEDYVTNIDYLNAPFYNIGHYYHKLSLSQK